MNSSSAHTIYVGNVQSIKDDQLREYFQRFGRIEAFYHNCTRAADEWLIDYRFIRFTSDTDMSVFLTNKIDHLICRIRLDIHPYQAPFSDETRLTSDRKICIAHTDSKLNRNVIKKAFAKYGRILNCTCVSSGNGVEYVYIEFESINSIRSVLSKQHHVVGRTALAVKQPLKPSQVEVKLECVSRDDRPPREQYQNRSSHVDTAQYSSAFVHQGETLRSQQRLSNNSHTSAETNHESSSSCSQQQLKGYEDEYEVIIRQDLDEITYQLDRFLRSQSKTYKKLQHYILNELQSQSSSSENEEGEVVSNCSFSSDSEAHNSRQTKRLKTTCFAPNSVF
ncbi:unnamed protein product [Adineta ricciae]|uniref:RRM domain-containing protein n=1 Tax=Adineta ricciae TaxID=249248 RepID=A0A814GAW5_ADIRI|nr:unnamed protein product [Adineta ricciae]CAF1612987.1 unnamed protein product [Adineta ricciae]